MIEMSNVSFAYNKNIDVISNMNLVVHRGDILGISGHNGAGKTTLMKLMMNILKPKTGKIMIDSELKIGYVPDEAGIYQELSAYQNLKFRLDIMHQKVEDDKIYELLKRLDLSSRFFDKQVKDWSHGMKKRLALAGSFIIEPDIIFLDEPTNGLDPESLAIIVELLQEESKKGVTIVLITHDLKFVDTICNRYIILQEGHLLIENEDQTTKLEEIYLQRTKNNEKFSV